MPRSTHPPIGRRLVTMAAALVLSVPLLAGCGRAAPSAVFYDASHQAGQGRSCWPLPARVRFHMKHVVGFDAVYGEPPTRRRVHMQAIGSAPEQVRARMAGALTAAGFTPAVAPSTASDLPDAMQWMSTGHYGTLGYAVVPVEDAPVTADLVLDLPDQVVRPGCRRPDVLPAGIEVP